VSHTIDQLADRLDRLERDLREVSVAVTRSRQQPPDRSTRILERVSFVAWLELTGPTFATLVLGFALLWNSLQATNAQMLEITRTVGRLEGSISALDGSVAGLRTSVSELQSSVGTLQGSVGELRGSVQTLSERVHPLER
jgi:peptidoglycan hydrolase CwlO-like protein